MKIFLKTGCVVCTAFLLTALFYEWIFPEISVTASANADEQPVRRLDSDTPVLALTFDVLGDGDTVDLILDILEKYQIRAAFFVTGAWVDTHPDDIKKIADAGHTLGSSGENHKNMLQLTENECCDELLTLHEKIKNLTGIDMHLFRPPYDACTPELIHTAKKCGYTTLSWDCDAMDWKGYSVEAVVNAVCRNSRLKNGSIIRMCLGPENTAEALETIIQNLKERGYDFVPLSEF